MENSVTDVIEGGEHGWRVSWIREDGEFFHHPSFHPHLAVHGHGAASREGCGKCPVVAHRLCRDMWIIEEGDGSLQGLTFGCRRVAYPRGRRTVPVHRDGGAMREGPPSLLRYDALAV